jgi:uncharacterized membrane protein YphA (DoxX/SURF4 family)
VSTVTSNTAPAEWLIRAAVAAVWAYEGVWCKLMHRQPHEFDVVQSVPYFGVRIGSQVLGLLGVAELGLAVWVLTGAKPLLCAVTQTLLLTIMNAAGLRWAGRLIPDAGGMVVKNFAFLVLAWVAAGLAGGVR